jgi:hypothetical protein
VLTQVRWKTCHELAEYVWLDGGVLKLHDVPGNGLVIARHLFQDLCRDAPQMTTTKAANAESASSSAGC